MEEFAADWSDLPQFAQYISIFLSIKKIICPNYKIYCEGWSEKFRQVDHKLQDIHSSKLPINIF